MAIENEINPETMDLEALRNLANDHMDDEPAEEQIEAADDEQQDEQVVYRREIDLGDGSGKQVFEADSPEALIDKLVQAQEHASRKIRELSAAQKAKEPAAPKYNDNDKFLLGQRFQQDPIEATDEIWQKTKAAEKINAALERLEAIERRDRETQSAEAFVKRHPEYKAVPSNGEKMLRYLQVYQLEGTPENLDRAFNELKSSGLLVLNTEESSGTTNEPQPGKATSHTSRIEKAGASTRTVSKVSSGLSARNSARQVPKAEPTEDELYAMPLDQLERLANRQLRGEAE